MMIPAIHPPLTLPPTTSPSRPSPPRCPAADPAPAMPNSTSGARNARMQPVPRRRIRRLQGAERHHLCQAVWASLARCASGLWPLQDLYIRFARSSRMGVFARIFQKLAQPGAQGDTLMMDSTFLKAHRTAASLQKKGSSTGDRTHERRPELQASHAQRRREPATGLLSVSRSDGRQSWRNRAFVASAPASRLGRSARNQPDTTNGSTGSNIASRMPSGA